MNKNTALLALSTENASPYSVTTMASVAETQIAGPGVRCAVLTRLSQREPGRPPSRANAYIIRDVDVTAASRTRS
jgi:hypothetical protein